MYRIGTPKVEIDPRLGNCWVLCMVNSKKEIWLFYKESRKWFFDQQDKEVESMPNVPPRNLIITITGMSMVAVLNVEGAIATDREIREHYTKFATAFLRDLGLPISVTKIETVKIKEY
jgi:hypothetical protein